MKQITKIWIGLISVALVSLLIVQCTYWPTNWDYRMPYGVGVFSVEEVLIWVADEIQYKSDGPEKKDDTWQLPHETYEKRTGDCEDKTILFVYLVYIEIGIENVEFVALKRDYYRDHALARIDNIYYDPTNGYVGTKKEDWEIMFELNFGEVMYQASCY